jgi:hypothetical protein
VAVGTVERAGLLCCTTCTYSTSSASRRAHQEAVSATSVQPPSPSQASAGEDLWAEGLEHGIGPPHLAQGLRMAVLSQREQFAVLGGLRGLAQQLPSPPTHRLP